MVQIFSRGQQLPEARVTRIGKEPSGTSQKRRLVGRAKRFPIGLRTGAESGQDRVSQGLSLDNLTLIGHALLS
jgi:hypothetical protein